MYAHHNEPLFPALNSIDNYFLPVYLEHCCRVLSSLILLLLRLFNQREWRKKETVLYIFQYTIHVLFFCCFSFTSFSISFFTVSREHSECPMITNPLLFSELFSSFFRLMVISPPFSDALITSTFLILNYFLHRLIS